MGQQVGHVARCCLPPASLCLQSTLCTPKVVCVHQMRWVTSHGERICVWRSCSQRYVTVMGAFRASHLFFCEKGCAQLQDNSPAHLLPKPHSCVHSSAVVVFHVSIALVMQTPHAKLQSTCAGTWSLPSAQHHPAPSVCWQLPSRLHSRPPQLVNLSTHGTHMHDQPRSGRARLPRGAKPWGRSSLPLCEQ